MEIVTERMFHKGANSVIIAVARIYMISGVGICFSFFFPLFQDGIFILHIFCSDGVVLATSLVGLY